jgi:hypothetical protein
MTPAELKRVHEVLNTGILRDRSGKLARLLREEGHVPKHGEFVPLSMRSKLKARLISDYGVAPEILQPGAQFDLPQSRRETYALLRDEKSGRHSVSQPVLMRHQPGGCLKVGESRSILPKGAWMGIDLLDIPSMGHEGIILIENFEAFRFFDDLNFPVPKLWKDYLLVFRGAPVISPQNHVQAFLHQAALPVIAFPDYDPAGLGQSLALPYVADILWPGEDALCKALYGHQGSEDIYHSQIAQYRTALENCSGNFRKVAEFLKKAGRGVMQEAFIRDL